MSSSMPSEKSLSRSFFSDAAQRAVGVKKKQEVYIKRGAESTSVIYHQDRETTRTMAQEQYDNEADVLNP